jgi:hypothetical protein
MGDLHDFYRLELGLNDDPIRLGRLSDGARPVRNRSGFILVS